MKFHSDSIFSSAVQVEFIYLEFQVVLYFPILYIIFNTISKCFCYKPSIVLTTQPVKLDMKISEIKPAQNIKLQPHKVFNINDCVNTDWMSSDTSDKSQKIEK